jgi:hypothetical protein
VSPAERQAWARGAAHAHFAPGGGGGLPGIRENGQAEAAATGAAAAADAGDWQKQEAAVAAAIAAAATAAMAAVTAADAAAPVGSASSSSDTAAPSAAPGGGGGGGVLLLDVAVSLKALIPELNSASLAITNRLIDRHLHHQHFGAHWAARPQAPVHQHAAVWWQHAGAALAAECARASRREVPLSALEQRRQRRLEYQALYAASHAASPNFQVSCGMLCTLCWWCLGTELEHAHLSS